MSAVVRPPSPPPSPLRRASSRTVRWYQDRAISVDPGTRTVRTSGGLELTAGDLVLCPGMEQDWDAIPGSPEAVFSPAVASTYVDERAHLGADHRCPQGTCGVRG